MTSRIFEEIVTSNVRPISECFDEIIDEWLSPTPAVRLKNLPMLDGVLGGFRPNELTILCGPTGSGKTSLLANISAQMLTTREKHFVASVETGYADFIKRVTSVLSGIDLNTGEPVSIELIEKIKTRYGHIIKADDLYLSKIDNRMSSDFLLKKLEYAVFCGCKVAMLDNLNFFLEIASASETITEMDRVIHDIIMFCKSNPIHIILVMHPKKTDGGRVLSEFDIKGSSTAVQESHNVLLFNRPEPNSMLSPHCREVKIAKLRKRGSEVGKTIVFDGTTPRYSEVQVNNSNGSDQRVTFTK